MARQKMVRLLLGLLLAWSFAHPACARVELPDPLWRETDSQGQTIVHLHFFWTRFCPHCQEALPFTAKLEKRYPWLRLHRYELTQSQENVEIYTEMAKLLGRQATSVPAFLFCETMKTGFHDEETTGRQMEEDLLACYRGAQVRATPNGPSDALNLPGLGRIEPGRHSLPMLTILIAGLDAFNPCAFFVLLFLMSLLIRSRDRTRMAAIGGLFVFFSGLMYFIFMAAWLNLFLFMGKLRAITFLAGVVAVGMGAVNVKDYYCFGKGFTLSIPESARPKLFERIRNVVEAGQWPAMIAGTVVLAVAANSYELLCTAGFPMVYTRILTLSQLGDAEYYIYLLFYNLVYIIPLLAIVVLFIKTMGARKLSEREGRLLKLLSGIMMLGLGLLLMFAPGLLNNVLAAFLLIVGAVVATLLQARRERSEIA